MDQMQIENVETRTYKYRWLIIALYGLYACASFYQLNQFTIIENVIERYYHTSSYLVNLTQLLFMIVLMIFIIPTVYFIEKFDLRTVGIISSGFTFLGSLVKLIATPSNSYNIYIILGAQGICAVGQTFLIMLPAKVVAVWCSKEEQNKACGISLWGGQIGMLAGAVTPILCVKNAVTHHEIEVGLFTLLMSNAVFCGLTFLAVLAFFKAKPPLPPSPQQVNLVNIQTNFLQSFKDLVGNTDFYWLVTLFGLSSGLWSAFGIVINMIYLKYFTDSLSDLAWISVITTILGGMIGNVAFGSVLDKTLKYKLLTFLSMLCITLSFAAMAVALEMRWHLSSFITVIIFGFFCSSSVNLSFQYIAEVTYPISEAITITVLQIFIGLVTIIYELIFNYLLDSDHYIPFHLITFVTLSLITSCCYYLPKNLKRMLVGQNVEAPNEPQNPQN